MSDTELERLSEMLAAAERVVVFTGAGISTESGIPDFRSPGGIWDKFRPIDFREFMASEDARRESWRRKFEIDPTLKAAEPNRGHRAVASLMNRGKVTAVITQNIDGLHQAAGAEGDRVIELHGNTTYARCLDCFERYELGPIKQAFLADETLPICEACGGIVKTATISFGQSMPDMQMAQAQHETLAADLFLAIGSSLVVYPAAGFPIVAKRNGSKLAILNREPTDLDDIADVVVNAEIGDSLGGIVGNN
jgi:NAD-dependent deacetylase